VHLLQELANIVHVNEVGHRMILTQILFLFCHLPYQDPFFLFVIFLSKTKRHVRISYIRFVHCEFELDTLRREARGILYTVANPLVLYYE